MISFKSNRATRTGLALSATALTTAVLGTAGLAPVPVSAQSWAAQGRNPSGVVSSAISSPAPGVICDTATRICYDGSGVSLPQTRLHMGSWAEWRLARQLSGQPAPTEFRLSDGSFCDVRARTCWSEAFGRRTVATQLSEQLFAGAGIGGQREVNRFAGLCNLMRGSREMYSGVCALRRVANSERGVTRYVVRQPNGSQLTFSDRSGRLEVSDGDRSWPATFVDHGLTGVFRWRDMTLVATREHPALPLGRLQSDGISQLFMER
ncbi:YcgJ family protein [Cyanobium sp. CH-040]|uniref:YcgJ family protein n=1 Tax=Cyanobium sp. CH-040 TaxID=2823708 RepID=UPI0020CCA4EF|nr:YcgJ family protein [Cyanobium sp. CH-040]MCP9928648.1 hypothetical protein [Cyanobium sp. CH-040]